MTPSDSDLKSDVESLIRNNFEFETRLEFINYKIPGNIKQEIEKKSGQKFFKDFLYMWKVYRGDDYIATGILDNVYGKSQPITFLVLINRYNGVMMCEIVKYREPYGGQISNKKWLDQFNGKDNSSSYKIGDEISTISGATISVNSITKGIRKLTILISLIGNDL
jgi:Na+-translocating ferredoxin:NAD+ oxidoreductase RnfG subunit